MADTYYGYAERTAENQIDWATIGKDLSKALTDEATIRKTKQVALETSIQEATKRMSNYEKGDSSLANKRAAELSSNVTQYLQTIQKLWKSGQLSTQQLTEGINNANTGIDGALELNKEYHAEFKNMKERAESADPATRSQLLEQWEKAEMGEFGNLNNSQYYIDPTSGLINLAKIKRETVDGKEVVTMGDEFITVNDARSRLKNEYNYFDSEKTTTDIAAALGTNITEIRERGGPSSAGIIRSITDPRYRKDLNDADAKVADLFESVVNQQIEGAASNPLNVSSFLTNDVRVDPLTGKAYTFTRDPNKQTSSDVILLKVDEMGRSYPDLSTEMGKKQLQVYKEQMRDKVIMKLDTKEELDTYNEPEPNYSRNDNDGSGDDDKYDEFSITVYENSNNALRTGNFANLDPKLASYQQGYDEKNKKYYVVVQEKQWSDDDQKYIAKGKPKRVYSADGLAKYVKGVDSKGVVPSQAYNRGKNDWSKQHEGNVLKGFYSKKDKESQTGVRRGQAEGDDIF